MPECDVFGDVVRVGEGGDVQRHVRWNHQAFAGQIAVASPEHRVEHGFVEEAVAHPFRYDDIDLRNREGNFFHFSAQAPWGFC